MGIQLFTVQELCVFGGSDLFADVFCMEIVHDKFERDKVIVAVVSVLRVVIIPDGYVLSSTEKEKFVFFRPLSRNQGDKFHNCAIPEKSDITIWDAGQKVMSL